jgi:hypothetical protein
MKERFVFKEVVKQELQLVVAPPEFEVGSDTEFLETEREPRDSFSRDFDSVLFGVDTPYGEIAHKVKSYLGEKLFMPRYEEIMCCES